MANPARRTFTRQQLIVAKEGLRGYLRERGLDRQYDIESAADRNGLEVAPRKRRGRPATVLPGAAGGVPVVPIPDKFGDVPVLMLELPFPTLGT